LINLHIYLVYIYIYMAIYAQGANNAYGTFLYSGIDHNFTIMFSPDFSQNWSVLTKFSKTPKHHLIFINI
jgi:hypothetical protein